MSSIPELFVGGESMSVDGDLVGGERVCEYRSRTEVTSTESQKFGVNVTVFKNKL